MGSTIQTADTSLAVVGGRVVTPDAVIDGGVRIAGEQIAAVGDIDLPARRRVDPDVAVGLIECAIGLAGISRLHALVAVRHCRVEDAEG